MANVNHSTLTGSFLHEPKGVAAAASGTVYIANGSGSGVWTNPQTITPLILTGFIDNISASSSVYVSTPYAGTIEKVTTVLAETIASADAVITVSNSASASMGTITVAYTSSAAGDVDSLTPSSNHTVTAGSYIKLTTNGASSNTARLYFSVTLDRS